MNYSRIYDEIIRNAKNRVLSGYSERHHIVPKALGGSDEKENIVKLTAREHAVAHYLLAKLHGGKMWGAATIMRGFNKRLSSRLYEAARTKHAENVGKVMKKSWQDAEKRAVRVAHLYNRVRAPLTLEHKEKLSAAAKRPHPPGSYEAYSAGQKRSWEEPKTRAARSAGISKSRTGKKYPKLSEAQKGRKLSEEHKQKLAESNRGLVRTEESRMNYKVAIETKRLIAQDLNVKYTSLAREAYLSRKEDFEMIARENVKRRNMEIK